MAVATHAVRPTGFAATERRDGWWVALLVQGLLLPTLVWYANARAIQGNDYYVPAAGGGGSLRERPRHRGRHARAADQHLRAHALQLLLPLGAPPGGRDPRLLLVQRPGARPSLGVAGRERAQRAPHGLRLDQLRRGVRG